MVGKGVPGSQPEWPTYKVKGISHKVPWTRFLMVAGTAESIEQTSHQLYGYYKIKVRKEYLKYDLHVYNEYIATVGPNPASGTGRKEWRKKLMLHIGAARSVKACVEWCQDKEARAGLKDMPDYLGGRTYLVLRHLGPLGEDLSVLRAVFEPPANSGRRQGKGGGGRGGRGGRGRKQLPPHEETIAMNGYGASQRTGESRLPLQSSIHRDRRKRGKTLAGIQLAMRKTIAVDFARAKVATAQELLRANATEVANAVSTYQVVRRLPSCVLVPACNRMGVAVWWPTNRMGVAVW